MSLPRCFGVFGDPIAHSRSPVMHTAAFAALGLPHRYLPFHVSPGGLGQAVRGAAALGFGGVNLTTPHKQAAVGLCDRLSATATRIAAVNTLCFVHDQESGSVAIQGHNTDGHGFLTALAELPGSAPRRATVLGAGGASLAIVDALLTRFPQLELTWVSRRPGRLSCIDAIPGARERVRPCSWAELDPRGDLLVNTTTVGLASGPAKFPVEIELHRLEPGARVIDIVYPRPHGPRPHGALLDRAEAAGLAVQDGLPMLLWQGVRALELWLATTVPEPAIAAMRAALYR